MPRSPSAAGQEGRARVWLEIRLDAIRRNFLRIRKTVRPSQVMPVLKADAYGLGALPIAAMLVEAGADRLGVAELKEALALKKRFPKVPVHILSGLLEREIPACVKHGIVCPVSDEAIAVALSRESVRRRRTTPVHIKIDTGMGRLGLPHEDARAAVNRIAKLPGLRLEGLCTHFANANLPRHGKTREQIAIFRALLKQLEADGLTFPLVHMANSDGINNFPEAWFDLVRTGINLYGVFDLQGIRAYHLAPSLTLKSTLLQRRLLPAGSTIGYGGTHALFRDTWVGTIPAGYADGVPLAASNSGRVLIRGKECPIIGRVSMDYITVDLSACPAARVGDEVVLVGKSGRKEFTIEDWARIKQTHPYDIICSLGPRVERVYL
jgi:alanine racemase